MRKTLFLFVLASFAAPQITSSSMAKETADSAAQDHQATLMEKFAGNWKARGTSFGLPSESSMTWTTELAQKFYRVEYRIDMQREGKIQTFLGHGYYRKGDNDGFWADTGGALHPMATSYSATTLKTIWGRAGEQQGRSHYTLGDDGTIEVIDWILRENGWHEFNRTLFRRENP